jgi:hypothetical protein
MKVTKKLSVNVDIFGNLTAINSSANISFSRNIHKIAPLRFILPLAVTLP